MEMNEVLTTIRNKLFYGSANYTKSQPDLFVPHRFKVLAPSQVNGFLDRVKEGLVGEAEILVYVHFPFCFSECLFCNSFPHKVNREVQRDYIDALLTEIDLLASQGVLEGKKVRCVYLGGGTPTSFSTEDIGRVLNKVSSLADMSNCISISSEAHPLTLSGTNRVIGLREVGVNRLSIGCQTFDQDILRLCNRSNTEEQIAGIVREVQGAGMSINIDMMTGLPGQTLESVDRDLLILERIRPNSVEYIRHEIVNPLVVSLYEERQDLVVSSDALFEMVYKTQEWMSRNGYEQNGRFTNEEQWGYRYNWLKEMPIIAFGSRARSYTKTICYDKYEDLSSYVSITKRGLLPIGRYIELTKKEQMFRSLLLGLQIKEGLAVAGLQRRFGAGALDVFSDLLERLGEYGCLQPGTDAVRLSKYGAYFVEDVCDCVIDTVLKEESLGLVRAPHSDGGTSVRLR